MLQGEYDHRFITSVSEAARTMMLSSTFAEPISNKQSRALRIAFLGHDSSESTIKKRVRAFIDNGVDVTGFMFRRMRPGAENPPEWRNIDLGITADGRFARRVLQLLSIAPKIVRERRQFLAANVIYARNVDMLAVAFLVKILTGSDASIVYEALDVHPACTGTGWMSSLLRLAERRMLARVSLLVVSSETFMEKYFRPIQRYKGEWFLLENKVFLSSSEFSRLVAEQRADHHRPWTIGWFGVIRCQRSLEILENLARSFPSTIAVHIRGTASETHGITTETLRGISDRNNNIHFFGPYRCPDDLQQIYGAIDLCWAIDYSAAGSNSDWLIPNRIYESGLCGIPSVSRSGTATARIIDKYACGWKLDEPLEDSVRDFISSLDWSRFAEIATPLRLLAPGTFIDESDTRALVRRLYALSTANFIGIDSPQPVIGS